MTPRQRLRRALFLLAGSLVVTALILLVRGAVALGLFSGIHPHFSGSCRALGPVAKVGGLTIDFRNRLLFVASGQPAGIYAMPLDRPGALAPVGGAGLNPGRLSLFGSPGGSTSLMAVEQSSPPAVDIFDVRISNGTVSLSLRTRITGSLLEGVTGLAAAGPDSFYATTDSVRFGLLGRTLEDIALWPQSRVVYFDGMLLKPVATGIARAEGLALSTDGLRVYVAQRAARSIRIFLRSVFDGSLKDSGEFSLAAGPAALFVDSPERLWVGARPRQVDRILGGADAPVPFQVFVLDVAGGKPVSEQELFAGMMGPRAGDGIAAFDRDLFLPGAGNRSLLACAIH
ncbi:MAG: hypothetical protein JOZ55_05310 [Alphaproteobacteria bacterium]|nr:hypothetical protein [Alphaproteobacteria bacterium]